MLRRSNRPAPRLRRLHSFRIVFVWVTAALLATTSCSSGDPDDDSVDPARLIGTWRTSEAPGIELPDSFDYSRATIQFTDSTTWQAFDGCNELAGQYALRADATFASGSSNVTVGCSDGAIPYDRLLAAATTVSFDSSFEVNLMDQTGKTVLTLRRPE